MNVKTFAISTIDPWFSFTLPSDHICISLIPTEITDKFLVEITVIYPLEDKGKDGMGLDFYRVTKIDNTKLFYGFGIYQLRYEKQKYYFEGLEVEVTDNRTKLSTAIGIFFPLDEFDLGLSLHSERGISLYCKAPF